MAYAAVRMYSPIRGRIVGFVMSLRDSKDRAGDDILIYLRVNAALSGPIICGLFDVSHRFKKGDTIYADDIASGRVVPIQFIQSIDFDINNLSA